MSNQRQNVTHLNNQYVSEFNYQQSLKMRRQKSLKRRMTVLLVVGFVLLLIPTVPLLRDYMRVRDFEAERVQATEHLSDLEDYQGDLEYYIELLNDEEYVAKLARSEYYLSKDEEVVFNLPEDYIPDHQRVIDEFHQEQKLKSQANE